MGSIKKLWIRLTYGALAALFGAVLGLATSTTAGLIVNFVNNKDVKVSSPSLVVIVVPAIIFAVVAIGLTGELASARDDRRQAAEADEQAEAS